MLLETMDLTLLFVYHYNVQWNLTYPYTSNTKMAVRINEEQYMWVNTFNIYNRIWLPNMCPDKWGPDKWGHAVPVM